MSPPAKLVTLGVWARAIYGEKAPHINTLRRWANSGYIVPLPKKHGTTYFVREDAQYMSPTDPDYLRLARQK
jgi:hypothetical protein